MPDWAEDWTDDLPTEDVECGLDSDSPQGPIFGRPSWTRDRSGTVVLGYDCHGWAVWSRRQVNPDFVNSYGSWSTFDEAQRLLSEEHPDGSSFDFYYTTRGLLLRVDFTEPGDPSPVTRPLIRDTAYDVQGRRVLVEYGDQLCTHLTTGEICAPNSENCDCEESGTQESYTYDARQRLSRKTAVRSDDLVVLDYRYTYDVASNIVRIDDDRPAASEVTEPGMVDGFVPYDIEYEYDALNRLVRATPIYATSQAHRVQEQTWSFDSLGSMETWEDDDSHFYGWSLGSIFNGLQLQQYSFEDQGVGPLPRQGDSPTGCLMDALGRCVPSSHIRTAVAPHALYGAWYDGGNDALLAYYDSAGNMTMMMVHRPDGCAAEETSGTSTPAAGGPDGAGCREGDDFRLLFAWDEVGNLLAVERQSLVADGTCGAPGGGWSIHEGDVFLLDGEDPDDYEWCPTARVESTYDFGGQRRLKLETNITDEVGRIPEDASLYVSASYEVRQATFTSGEWGGADAVKARYLWNEAGILYEIDSDVPEPVGVATPKTRLTLTNQIGSASTVLDVDTGAVSQILSQLPYGAEEQTYPRAATTGDDTAFAPRYEFTGKERDRGVGLVYFGARSLDSRLGRWVSVDPAATHAFQATSSSPVQGVDPNPTRSQGGKPTTAIDTDGRELLFLGSSAPNRRFGILPMASIVNPTSESPRVQVDYSQIRIPNAQQNIDNLLGSLEAIARSYAKRYGMDPDGFSRAVRGALGEARAVGEDRQTSAGAGAAVGLSLSAAELNYAAVATVRHMVTNSRGWSPNQGSASMPVFMEFERVIYAIEHPSQVTIFAEDFAAMISDDNRKMGGWTDPNDPTRVLLAYNGPRKSSGLHEIAVHVAPGLASGVVPQHSQDWTNATGIGSGLGPVDRESLRIAAGAGELTPGEQSFLLTGGASCPSCDTSAFMNVPAPPVKVPNANRTDVPKTPK